MAKMLYKQPKKFPQCDKQYHMELLKDNHDTLKEELSDDFTYAEIMSIMIPMAFDNIFEHLECELVLQPTTDGSFMGFFLEGNRNSLLTVPNLQNNTLDICVFFENRKIYGTSLKYQVEWTGNLFEDCLSWDLVLNNQFETIGNMIRLLKLDTKNCIIQ
jgi:hypothetical protein